MIQDCETLEREKVLDMQSKLLVELIGYISKNSPFYISQFKEQGIDVNSIKGVEDLHKLPFTTKEDLRTRNWDFLAVPRDKIVEMVCSSGTTGTPTFIAFTKNDLDRLAFNEKLGFECAGTTPKDVYQLTVTNDSMFVAGNAFYRGIIEAGATALRFGPGNSLRQLMMLKDLKVTGFASVPSYLVTLGQKYEELGMKKEEFDVKRAVLVGESIRKEDFSLNGLGKKIKDYWDIELFSCYGNTEMSTSLTECEFHKGNHIHPNLLIIEIVDDEGNPVGDYEKGELVITTLGTEGMPLLRYKTGDITFKISEKCECGRTAERIGPILSRKNHLLKVKGSNVYPGHIENALLDIPHVVNYVIEAHTAENYSDHVLLKIGTHTNSPELVKEIQDKVKAYARMTPEIVMTAPDEVSKQLFANNERKPKKFWDMRNL